MEFGHFLCVFFLSFLPYFLNAHNCTIQYFVTGVVDAGWEMEEILYFPYFRIFVFWTLPLLILFNDPILRFSWRPSWTPDWRLCRWWDWHKSWCIPAWWSPGMPGFQAKCRESILYSGRPECCRWKMEPSKPGNSLKRIHINYGDARIRFNPKVLKEIFLMRKVIYLKCTSVRFFSCCFWIYNIYCLLMVI